MDLIRRFLSLFRRKPPVISTPFGSPVPERWRRQAETNLRLDPAKREAVLAIIVKECGGNVMAGLREARRRYPKAGF